MGNSKDTVSMVGARLAAAIKRLGDVESKFLHFKACVKVQESKRLNIDFLDIFSCFSFSLTKHFSSLDKKKGDGSYWALATAAALYWRVKGNPHAAITCLIQSLDYAPRHMEVCF